MMTKRLVSLFLLLGLFVTGCQAAQTGNDQSGMIIDGPFVRASIPNGAAFMSITNQTGQADLLLGAATEAAETVELHETKMDENEVMRMSPVPNIPLPAGETVSLEPGGLHIMLLGLNEDLAAGDTVELTLNFEQAEPLTLQVEVRQGQGMGQTEEMGH